MFYTIFKYNVKFLKKKKERIDKIYSSTPKDFLSNSALTNPSL